MAPRFGNMRLAVTSAALLWAGIALFACRPASAQDAGYAEFNQRADIALLLRVNREVNSAHRPGSPLPNDLDGVYDCENYANDKILRLKALGVPPGRIERWTTRTSRGELHAVIVVDGWVLDNRSPWLTRKEQMNYTDWRPASVFWTAQLR